MSSTPSFEELPLEAVRRAAHYNHDHRSVQTGGLRAAVFGASDGLVSNAALILGVAAADPSPGVVRLAGVAGLIAGAVSMAAGEYISMRAQTELWERELAVEKQALRDNPALEKLELVKIYESKGLEPDLAEKVADAMMRDPETALDVHAREELGIDPDELGSPFGASGASFVSFAIGAIVPLLPWLFGGGSAAIVATIVLGTIGAAVLGGIVGWLSGRSIAYAAARQTAIAIAAAAVTYGIGAAVGVGV